MTPWNFPFFYIDPPGNPCLFLNFWCTPWNSNDFCSTPLEFSIDILNRRVTIFFWKSPSFVLFISGIFSPVNSSQEETVARLMKETCPGITYTLSNTLGYLGLLERENATILNESLKVLCEKTVSGFRDSLQEMGLSCPVFFTQNDGTLIRYVY